MLMPDKPVYSFSLGKYINALKVTLLGTTVTINAEGYTTIMVRDHEVVINLDKDAGGVSFNGDIAGMSHTVEAGETEHDNTVHVTLKPAPQTMRLDDFIRMLGGTALRGFFGNDDGPFRDSGNESIIDEFRRRYTKIDDPITYGHHQHRHEG